MWGSAAAGRRAALVSLCIGVAGAISAPGAIAGHYTTGFEQVLLTNSEWRNAQTGLEFWPDGPMGIERDASVYTFYTANGPNVARTVGSLYNPIATSVEPDIEVLGARDLDDVGYASGGPVYTDPATGMKLMFLHIERYPQNPPQPWYSPTGLAKSVDGGHTWTFLGEFLTHDISYEEYKSDNPCADQNLATFNTGSGQYVIREVGGVDYFYVYGFNVNVDVNGACSVPFTASRAPVADVVAAAASGGVSMWSKYYEGAWTEPGIGGKASNILPPNVQRGPFDIAYNAYRGRYTMVMARGFGSLYSTDLYESADGVTWSNPESIALSLGEVYAPTIVGLGADPRTPAKTFYVYYTYSLSGGWGRFTDSELRRRSVTFD